MIRLYQTKTHHLYRWFNSANQLLYVGISLSAFNRAKKHAVDASWYNEASKMTVKHFKNRTAALKAEKRAIEKERPAFNLVHNGKRPNRFSHIIPEETVEPPTPVKMFLIEDRARGGWDVSDKPDGEGWFNSDNYPPNTREYCAELIEKHNKENGFT